MYNSEKTQKAFDRVQDVIEKLLDPKGGCPWDKEQTPDTMTEYLIEECFECVDAIRQNKPAHALDEMGDLLFNLIFVAHRYSEQNKFDISDVLNAAADKMIRRHPHVFADVKVENKEELMANWAEIKKQEKLQEGIETKGVYTSLVRNLPPLTKAYRVHAKAAQAGFTWESDDEVEQQVEAEYLELFDALQSKNPEAIEHELGDMFFTLVELGRRKGIKSSHATDKATLRFLERFEAMEALAKERGLEFETLSLDEKDTLWNEVKQNLAK